MPQADKEFHIFTEALSVLVAAPLLWHIGAQQANPNNRLVLQGMAVILVLVDGYLLTKWREW